MPKPREGGRLGDMGAKRQGGTEGTRNKSKGNAERTSDEAAPKRQRVSRACDQCRTAREKCDGIQPLCFPCASQNRSCSWEEPKKKRGVQTGYIRTLEMALGWIFDKIPESELALHGLLTHEGGQGRMLLAGKNTQAGTHLHRRWRKSTVHAEIERVLSSDAASTKPANGSTPDEDTDDDDPEKDLLAIHDMKSTTNVPDLGDHLKAESDVPERTQQSVDLHEDLAASQTGRTNAPTISSKSQSLPHPLHQPARPNVVGLPFNHWRLLDIYFSYTHVWFPILEKSELLKTGYSYPDEGLHITRDTPGSAGHAELWAALALASYQETASRTHEGAEEVLPSAPGMKPTEMYNIARDLIPVEDGFFEARHINTLLLLALVKMACNDLNAAWMIMGAATRVALLLRLHENSNAIRHRRSSHTYMGCFILDTLLSAHLGLPPHLRSNMVYLGMPCLENDLDEWQPWMPCADFGPARAYMRSSRMPSHSISSFCILHRIHVTLSRRLWDESGDALPMGNVFLHTLQSAVSQCGADASLSSCIVTGESMMGQLPSIHILRLAFLSAASMCTGLPYLQRAALACIESYMSNFGICGLSPLLPVFMKLVDQQAQNDHDLLTWEARARWKQIEKAIESVWTKSTQDSESGIESGTRWGEIRSTYRPQPLHTAFSPVSKAPLQQSLVNTSFRPNMNVTRGPVHIGIPFPPNPNVEISEPVNHPPPIETRALRLNRPPAAVGEFSDMDTSAMPSSLHFPLSERPRFGGQALDYDTILDDIASFDRADVPESDTQFMANLGLRPGTNLADVFPHEFMGFP